MTENQIIRMLEYSPATCITAKELRKMGFPVPDAIPDDGWIPRSGIVTNATTKADVEQEEQDTLHIDMTLSFNAPFRWIEITVSVTKEV